MHGAAWDLIFWWQTEDKSLLFKLIIIPANMRGLSVMSFACWLSLGGGQNDSFPRDLEHFPYQSAYRKKSLLNVGWYPYPGVGKIYMNSILTWAEVHISIRVIVFVCYGKKMKCIRILGHKWTHMDSGQKYIRIPAFLMYSYLEAQKLKVFGLWRYRHPPTDPIN